MKTESDLHYFYLWTVKKSNGFPEVLATLKDIYHKHSMKMGISDLRFSYGVTDVRNTLEPVMRCIV